MNAPTMNLNPVQSQSPSGKQADRTSSEPSGPPFSEVLSSEMANNRQGDPAAQTTDADARPETATPSGSHADTTNAAAPETETTAAGLAAPERAAVVVPAGLPGLSVAPGRTGGDAEADPLSGLGADDALPFPPAARGRAARAAALGQPAEPTTRGVRKDDAAVALKTDAQATARQAASTAFSEQLTASRKAGALMAGDAATEPPGVALRAAPHAAFASVSALHEAAAPRLAPQLGTTAWNQALGEKIVWMAGAAQQTATLTLNPPNMGPLQVVINLSNDQATANFFSAQPEVRQALEAAFPRLREMMNEAGIELGQATVSSETPQQNERDARQAPGIVRALPGDDDALAGLHAGQLPIRQSRGLVDTFA
jgi:flagellar hook-length control protein FliK